MVMVIVTTVFGLAFIGMSAYAQYLKSKKVTLNSKYNITVEFAERLSNENLQLKAKCLELETLTVDLVNDLSLAHSKISLLEQINTHNNETNKTENNGKKPRLNNKNINS